MSIRVDTGAVTAAANRINNINTKLNSDFNNAVSSISGLDAAWDSRAASAAIAKFRSIQNEYTDERFTVINNLVSFMRTTVGENYENVENSAVRAAAQFK